MLHERLSFLPYPPPSSFSSEAVRKTRKKKKTEKRERERRKKTLQTSFGGGERERRREKREAKGGRERERTERERRRERLLSAERSLPVRCLISFKPLNDFGFQGQSPEEAFLSCETFFREKLQEKKKKRKRREIWRERERERELVRRHSGHRRLLVTCCVAFAGSKSSRTLQTRA